MKKVLAIICVGMLFVALMTSCGARRGDNGCPNNFGMIENTQQQVG